MRIDATLVNIILNLHVLLNNDAKKVAAWLNTENPNFGGVSPIYLIDSGRAKKVVQFIELRLEEEGL